MNVSAALLGKAADTLVETARLRQPSFWSEALPDVQAEWALIAVSGKVLLEADRSERELKQPSLVVKTIFERYTGGAVLTEPPRAGQFPLGVFANNDEADILRSHVG